MNLIVTLTIRILMFFVYIIKSLNFANKIYVGCTNNLKKRLTDHNSGHSIHTSKYKPWALMVFIGFKTKSSAMEFEQYLKTGSGRAFIAKRLLALL